MDEEGRPEHREADEHLKRIEQHLAQDDEDLERLEEEIGKAERTSKRVIPDPEPGP
jgi:hypothetical protein